MKLFSYRSMSINIYALQFKNICLMGHLEKSSYKMGDGEENIVGERLIFAKACDPVILVERERER